MITKVRFEITHQTGEIVFLSHSSFNLVLAMRFRSDCKYTKAALNLGSTHQLLASILALKNKEGSQVDALILWHITD